MAVTLRLGIEGREAFDWPLVIGSLFLVMATFGRGGYLMEIGDKKYHEQVHFMFNSLITIATF